MVGGSLAKAHFMANLLVKLAQVSVIAKDSNKILLDNINLSVGPQQIISIIGPNGAGKTTLIKAIVGLTPISSGQRYLASNLKIGYVPQKFVINPNLPLTVKYFLTNLAPGKFSTIDFAKVCETVDIQSLLNQALQSLSGGELQRVLLARALLISPDLLVLDEPVQGVDVIGQAKLYELIYSIKNQYNCAVVLVSHDLHIVMQKADTVVCLNKHICCSGHPEAISSDPEFTKLFGNLNLDTKTLGVYTHYHDHQHDLKGKVIKNHDD